MKGTSTSQPTEMVLNNGLLKYDKDGNYILSPTYFRDQLDASFFKQPLNTEVEPWLELLV